MKKLISFSIVLIALFLVVSVSFASDLYPREDGGEPNYVNYASTDSDRVVVSAPCFLYAVSLYNEAASSKIDIVDSASATAGTIATMAVELAEATAGEYQRIVFDPPIRIKNGIYVDVSASLQDNVVVEYR